MSAESNKIAERLLKKGKTETLVKEIEYKKTSLVLQD